jgi:acetylornithine deacetylase/succinyl-diaminopimelate desuccinylase-like protein
MKDDLSRVLELIDESELIDLALALGKIDSPTGQETEAGDFVFKWMSDEGFAPRRVGLFEHRFNVVGRLPGTGGGRSLSFNSHLDTNLAVSDLWLDPRAADPIHHTAWREGDRLFGNGIVNDKGPLAAWLIAARAIRKAGVDLRGDLVLAAVIGEIGAEAIDEFHAWNGYGGKEAGTRFAVQHGALTDYAIVAEGTDFTVVGVEAGMSTLKVTVRGSGTSYYTSFIPDRGDNELSPNAVVRMASLIPHLDSWCREYPERHRVKTDVGTVVPKVNIGAVRGGVPYKLFRVPQQAAVYLDVRLAPGQDVLDVRDELVAMLDELELPGQVDVETFRPSFVPQGTEPLVEAIATSHKQLFDADLTVGEPPLGGLWRDVNVYAELGIPAVEYGPPAQAGGGNYSLAIEDLVAAAKAYALIALDVCNQDRMPREASATTAVR